VCFNVKTPPRRGFVFISITTDLRLLRGSSGHGHARRYCCQFTEGE
jgi:hypothetical protein